MGSLLIEANTQRIVVTGQQRIEVADRTVNVINSWNGVAVISAGPQGPPGVQGLQGPPGQDAETQIDDVMYGHVNDPTPHPAYDDMPDLTVILENGLI